MAIALCELCASTRLAEAQHLGLSLARHTRTLCQRRPCRPGQWMIERRCIDVKWMRTIGVAKANTLGLQPFHPYHIETNIQIPLHLFPYPPHPPQPVARVYAPHSALTRQSRPRAPRHIKMHRLGIRAYAGLCSGNTTSTFKTQCKWKRNTANSTPLHSNP
ncbi:hypothetical protein CPB86DRAFT_878798 [Serendipita vermifera]|nr:hypothetical protein CPB86DRAFT_878798 [Serendipita vermifera]